MESTPSPSTASKSLMRDDKLNPWDIAVVGVYFALVLAVGLLSMCRRGRGTISGYFLAGRHMVWLPVGASLFASNIGSEHFIGLAGSGAASGIAVGAFEFNSLVMLQILGWIFLPVFIASGVCTLPEYMNKRFGSTRIRVYLAVLSMFLYVVTKISVNLYSGALFIKQGLGWNLYVSVIILLAITAVCTIGPGLAGVIYTDTLQFFIMMIGSFILMIKSFNKVGGFAALQEKYMAAVPSVIYENTTCGVPRADSWVMLRDPVNSDMPWPGFLLGQTPASIWYWCADQMMVQRALAAQSLSHAQGGTLFAGFAKVLPVFLMVMPGMISRVLYTDEVACATPETCMAACGSDVSCTNMAYPKLVLDIMPVGLRGLMMAVMLAALTSDLTSIFNSASTLFTIDIWKRVKKGSSTRELLIVGRLFVVVMVVVSVLWIPIIENLQGGQLYIYIQSVAAALSPPIAAVYTLAICWTRMNEKGAFWGLFVGFVSGVIRLVLEVVYPEPRCFEVDDRPFVIAKVHYLYFATILFWLTVLICVVVSLLTEPPESFRIIRTTYWTRFDRTQRPDDGDRAEFETMTAQQKTGDEEFALGDLTHSCSATPAKGSPPSEDTSLQSTVARPGNVCSKIYDWVCGFEDPGDQLVQLQEERNLMRHLDDVSSLDQTSTQKWILNTFLVIILTLTVFLYTVFSVPSPITTVPPAELPDWVSKISL